VLPFRSYRAPRCPRTARARRLVSAGAASSLARGVPQGRRVRQTPGGQGAVAGRARYGSLGSRDGERQ